MPSHSRIRHRGPILTPAPKLALTQKHSFELMKTVITATISHILWARYDPADPEVSYDAFIKGVKGRPVSFDASENLMIWKILPRAQDFAADKVLDCLEIGAADALERGYLAKLQVSLHSIDEDIITNTNLIESYSMMFEYKDGQSPKISSEFGTKSSLIKSAKQDLYELVNDVGFLIYHSNRHRSSEIDLPDQFRMLLSLEYNSQTPADYQPPMFRPGDKNTINILRSSVSNPNLSMNTGFHSVSVGIHILENTEATPICQIVSKVNDIDTAADDETVYHVAQQTATMHSQIEGIHTQPDAVKQLQKIGISRNLNSDTQDTVKLSISNSHRMESLKISRGDTDKLEFPTYTQSVLDNIQSAQELRNTLSQTSSSLECECKVSIHDEALLKCVICGNSKHIRCYGYLDGIIPAEVVCYTCLLVKSDKDYIDQVMKPLAIKRRALYYLREKGVLSTSSELAPQLNLPKYKITRLLADFKVDGLLKGSSKDRKRAPMATYIGDDEKLRMLYFRPQKGIDHLFTIPESPVIVVYDSVDQNPEVSSNSTQNYKTPDQVQGSRNRSYSITNNYSYNIIGQPDKRSTADIEDSHQLVINLKKETTESMKATPSVLSSLASSTQGTPSPRPRGRSFSIYQEQEYLDQQIESKILNKRSFSTMEPDVESKRHKTSKASPWLIRNY